MRRIGTIYVLRDPGNLALKIGFTNNFKKRWQQHKISNPFLVVVKQIENATIQDEKLIHQKLTRYRVHDTTEWFFDRPESILILNKFLITLEAAIQRRNVQS